MARILIIDDNETMREGLGATVRRMGHEAVLAASGADGMDALATQAPPTSSSPTSRWRAWAAWRWSRPSRERDPDCPAMIVTAFGTVETAVEAMRLGAFDFLQKPFAPEVVRLKVERALELRAREAWRASAPRPRSRRCAPTPPRRYRFGEHGRRDAGRCGRVFQTIEKVAPTDASVLHPRRVGHRQGAGRARHPRPLEARRRALRQGELRRAHRDAAGVRAVRPREGRLHRRHQAQARPLRAGRQGGTLFLDEIGDITPALQLKLLRVLQEREFERVGGEETIKVDVRVVSATHRDIRPGGRRRALPRGSLLPPARRALSTCRRCASATRTSRAGRALHREAGAAHQRRVKRHRRRRAGAPVRLRVARQRARAGERHRAVAGLRRGRRHRRGRAARLLRGATAREHAGAAPGDEMPLPDILEDLERQLIQRAYEKTGGVKTETARLLGIKTCALYYKLEKYGIGTIESRGEKASPGLEGDLGAETLLEDGPPGGGGGGQTFALKPAAPACASWCTSPSWRRP